VVAQRGVGQGAKLPRPREIMFLIYCSNTLFCLVGYWAISVIQFQTLSVPADVKSYYDHSRFPIPGRRSAARFWDLGSRLLGKYLWLL
jgi:hypothetical protein